MSKEQKRTGNRLAALAAAAGVLAGGLCAGQARAAEYEVRMPVEKTVRIAPVGEASDQEPAKAPEAKPAKPEAKPAKPEAKPAKPEAKPAKPTEAKPGKPEAKPAKPEAKPAKSEAKPAKAEGKPITDETAKPADKAPRHAPAKPTPAPVKTEEGAMPAPEHKAVSTGKPAAKAASKKSAKPATAVSADPDAQSTEPALSSPSAASAPSAEPAPKPVPTSKPAPKPAPQPKLDPKALVLPAAPASTGAIAALPADGLWVGEISVEYQEERVIVHAATSKPVDHTTWFNQAEPRKLAVDLRGEWRKKGAHVLRLDTGPVKNLIVGEHQDRLRVAVEFRDGAVAPGLEPKVETGADGVTVTIPLAVGLKR